MGSDNSLGVSDFMVSTQIGPYEENRDFMQLKLSSGLLMCRHIPAGAYTWINETYYILWTMQEWLDAIAASGKTTEEFMAGIYRGPGKIGVVTDGRCEYCKAGLPVPPEMY